MERNHTIQIGEIFYSSFSDEDGCDYRFYQVVGLRAKTIVQVVSVPKQYYLDKFCRNNDMCVGVRPKVLKENQLKNREIMEGKGCDYEGIPGLRAPGHGIYGQGFSGCSYDPKMKCYETGYWGGCARALWEKKKAQKKKKAE